MIMKARFDGRVFVPEKPVELPAGSVVQVTFPVSEPLSAESDRVLLGDLAKQFPVDPDLPADGAEQHDHYLYGTPKRNS